MRATPTRVALSVPRVPQALLAPLALLALPALVALPSTAAAADDPLLDFGALEGLAEALEVHGLVALPPNPGEPLAFREPLRFDPEGSDLAREQAFRGAWRSAYLARCEALIDAATAAAGDNLPEKDRAKPHAERLKPLAAKLKTLARKDPLAAALLARIAATAPRYEEVLALAGESDAARAKVFAERERRAQQTAKRYDFGPKIAVVRVHGSAVIDVDLAADTYAIVEREIAGWRFEPLRLADGAQMEVRGRKVELARSIANGLVRDTLRGFTSECFVVRYGKLVDDKRVDAIRVVGARLAYGTYYVLELGERIVVVKEATPR